MDLLHLIFPSKIHLPDSRYNKNIVIHRYGTSATLTVDNLTESGDVMTQVWRKGITALLPRGFKPQSVLLLGLAGGCNAKLINKYFPKAQITAVEIDPKMVAIGQKYFDLDKTKNLQIVVADALDFVNQNYQKLHFDLVMVDCFIGKEIPKKLEAVAFLEKLKSCSRYVLINRLWWYKEKIETARFFRSISPHFFFIKAHTISNVIISLV